MICLNIDSINFMSIDIRASWDEADKKYQEQRAELGIDTSTVAAYLAIQQSFGIESSDTLLDGFETGSGGQIQSPIPSIDDLRLRADR